MCSMATRHAAVGAEVLWPVGLCANMACVGSRHDMVLRGAILTRRDICLLFWAERASRAARTIPRRPRRSRSATEHALSLLARLLTSDTSDTSAKRQQHASTPRHTAQAAVQGSSRWSHHSAHVNTQRCCVHSVSYSQLSTDHNVVSPSSARRTTAPIPLVRPPSNQRRTLTLAAGSASGTRTTKHHTTSTRPRRPRQSNGSTPPSRSSKPPRLARRRTA